MNTWFFILALSLTMFSSLSFAEEGDPYNIVVNPEIVEGAEEQVGLRAQEITDVISSNLNQVRACYELELQKDPEIDGPGWRWSLLLEKPVKFPPSSFKKIRPHHLWPLVWSRKSSHGSFLAQKMLLR